MAVKVAINGFGRIGRLAFRRIQDVEGIESCSKRLNRRRNVSSFIKI